MRAATPLGRAILFDGAITDEELQELKASYIHCLEDAGYTQIEVNDDGSGGYISPPRTDEDGTGTNENGDVGNVGGDNCDPQTDWGVIGSLHHFVQGNPDNIDMSTIMAECLVRVGIESEGYGAESYTADFISGRFSNMTSTSKDFSAYNACTLDPAHAGQ